MVHKNSKLNKGFTIVELLVVIVVIGILAAISIVSYSGVTAKAKTAKTKDAAQSIANAADLYNSENSKYPTLAEINAYDISKPTGLLGGTLSAPVSGAAGTSAYQLTKANGLSADYKTVGVVYAPKSTTGACVGYLDYTETASPFYGWIYSGNANSATFSGAAGTNLALTCN